MATAPLKQSFLESEDQFGRPPWFDQTVRSELIQEDLDAGRTVCGVLITIVIGGLLLGIAAVLLTL